MRYYTLFISFSILLILTCLLSSCKSLQNAAQVNRKELTVRSFEDSLSYLLQTFEEEHHHFCGFVLHDPDSRVSVISHHADRFFTPASNLKIFTLLASQLILADSIPALSYHSRGDSLLIRGTGDPSFMTKNDVDSTVYHFLKERNQDIYFDASNFKSSRLGSGWAWDDYPNSYQKELSPMPIYGNGTILQVDSASRSYEVIPNQNVLLLHTDEQLSRFAKREEQTNTIFINNDRIPLRDAVIDIPSIMADSFFFDQLSHAVSQPIYKTADKAEDSLFVTLYHDNSDSLYQDLMLRSDNFVAEQLLLMCAYERLGYLSTRAIIKEILAQELADLEDDIRWVDGSGLSRYSLITPRATIAVLDRLSDLLSKQEISEWFPSNDHPESLPSQMEGLRINAKTGTLSNNFNLSGYLVTNSEKPLIFSFMNNHFRSSNAEIAAGMARILSFIQANY